MIRRCASVADTGVTGVCNWGVKENGVYWEECYCAQDGCNGGNFVSPSLTVSILLFLASFIIRYWTSLLNIDWTISHYTLFLSFQSFHQDLAVNNSRIRPETLSTVHFFNFKYVCDAVIQVFFRTDYNIQSVAKKKNKRTTRILKIPRVQDALKTKHGKREKKNLKVRSV